MGVTFEHPGVLAIAMIFATIAFAVAWRRAIAVPRATLALAGGGAVLFALAAGGAALRKPMGEPVTVLVDVSPSTRGARFLEVGQLKSRVRELIGDRPYAVQVFADGLVTRNTVDQAVLSEVPATRTMLPVIDAPAVLLFSDGRFGIAGSRGAMPPVYAVIDPALDEAMDGAVSAIEARSGDDDVTIRVRNSGLAPRVLDVQGLGGEDRMNRMNVPPGSVTLARRRPPGATTISASLAPGDRWPENDAIRVPAPPAAVAERWWVGGTPPAGSGWKSLAPSDLPSDATMWVGTSAVVLDNLPADSLSPSQQAAVQRYVRQLGGGVGLLGGDRAFAAGGYAGTPLDAISPLASTPPEPAMHWLLLADASGSMNRDAGGGRTRWQFAADAVVAAARQLPPADVLSIGGFARDVRWWSDGATVSETLSRPLPPADLRPGGPTNLDAALRDVAERADGNLPKQLLIATDAQAVIADAAGLGAQLKARNVQVCVLLIGDPSGATALSALKLMVNATGGTLREATDARDWAPRLQELARAAQPDRLRSDATTARFVGPLAPSLPTVAVPRWNMTWPRAGTTPLAEAKSADGGQQVMAAEWNVGDGRVAAVAFAPAASVTDAIVKRVERPPRDPRLAVAWELGSTVRAVVDAVDGMTYLNGERLILEVSEAGGAWSSRLLPQTGPGRYESSIETPRRSGLARVRHAGRVRDTVALPERYAPEFDAIGNDRAALADLARRTGGAVIEPGVIRPLDLSRPYRVLSAVSFVAAAGAAFVLAGLVRWRIGS